MSITMTKQPRVIRPQQRRILLDHIDGPIPFIAPHHRQSMDCLIAAGLITGVPSQSGHPTHTRLTSKGREEVAAILAEAAEVLISAGCMEREIAERVRQRPIFLTVKAPPADKDLLTTPEST